MTFLELQQNVYRKTGHADTPSAETSTRVKMFLNEVHRRVLGLPGMDYLRVGKTTLTTVASTARYGFAYDVARVMAIRDTTNDITLGSESFQWYTGRQPDPSAITGTPQVWVPVGYGPLRLQPSDSSTIYAVSSSASDTQVLAVEGISGGHLTSAVVTLTGTTKKSLGTWTQIDKLYLNTPSVGTIAIWEDDETTGTLLGTLPIARTAYRYFTIALWPTPSAAVSLTVDYMRLITDMVSNTDEPLLPEDFHWIISSGARVMEYEKSDDNRYAAARFEYDKGVRDLKWYVTQRADSHETMGAGRWSGSQLGPWYPRGT